jgi:acyl-CoA synthetase (AMP-forming)/AMP-acid ligase II
VLAPLACQLSVDYFNTRDFAMRPRLWLDLMSRSRATISFGPPFGYDLVARSLRPGQAQEYDLTHWRVAGVGAEMVRAEVLHRFAKRLAPAGFKAEAFTACYGMAVRGQSVMSGYLGDAEATRKVLSEDGWLNTGDIGYQADGHLFLTGRRKDMIIINGRNIWPQDLEYIAEQQPEIRPGDALAFAAPAEDGTERTVLVVQCRKSDPRTRSDLIRRIKRRVYEELAIDCVIVLVPLHTLPRTSSGKLSRSWARLDYLGDTGRNAHQGSEQKPGEAQRERPRKRAV